MKFQNTFLQNLQKKVTAEIKYLFWTFIQQLPYLD